MKKKYVILPIIIIQLILVLISSAEAKAKDDYEYLIVTTDTLKDLYGDFIEFNTRRCLRTKVQTIDYIKADTNITGKDYADKLRKYIIQEFTDHNIVYVLLGGDGDDDNNYNDIPDRGFRAQCYDGALTPDRLIEDKDIAADMYYSCLDGDWLGGNAYYGEYGTEDMEWDVYAARFPVDNETELYNMINKTIKYSEQPVVNEVKNVLLSDDNPLNPDSTPPPAYLDELIGICSANGYTTIGFTDFTNTWDITKMYHCYDPYSTSDIQNKIKEEKITWINHQGHANKDYLLKHTSSDVTDSNFTNNGSNANFFILYTQGDYAGSFDNRNPSGSYIDSDCIGERFTAEISNGAVAFIGSSRFVFWGVYDGTDWAHQRLQRYFHDAIFNKKIHHLEMMNAYSKEANAEIIAEPDIKKQQYYGAIKWACYSVNVLGDPALSIWTEKPKQWTNINFSFNGKKFEMDTETPYTWIALCGNDGNIIATQLTGEDGICKIEDTIVEKYFQDHPDEDLKVRIKAHNYFPFLSDPVDIQTENFNKNTAFQKLIIRGNTIEVNYLLLNKGPVNISLYNSKGSLIKTLINKDHCVGEYLLHYNCKGVSTGIYYMRCKTDNSQYVNKIIVTE